MGIQKVDFQSSNVLPLSACDCIKICLTDEAAALKVTGGNGLINATVGHGVRHLGNGGSRGRGSLLNSLRSGEQFNSRNTSVVQYTLEIDDSQLETNPATQAPYVITCDDIVELNPYCCTVNKLEA